MANDPLAFTGADVVEVLKALFEPAWARLDEELPTLSTPVLAVHGSDDQIAPVTGVLAWQDRLPGLRVEIIDDAAHDVLNETVHRAVADHVGRHVVDHALTGANA